MTTLYIWTMDNSNGNYRNFGNLIWCGTIFPDEPGNYFMHNSEAECIESINNSGKGWKWDEIKHLPMKELS